MREEKTHLNYRVLKSKLDASMSYGTVVARALFPIEINLETFADVLSRERQKQFVSLSELYCVVRMLCTNRTIL